MGKTAIVSSKNLNRAPKMSAKPPGLVSKHAGNGKNKRKKRKK